jgi:phosphatidylglycerol:prolipoprotein diacylglycerol transferase
MYPTLFRIGHFSVSTYGVIVAIAALTAGWIAARAFRERGLDGDHAWSLLVYGLIGGFVGAKLYYVALHGDPAALLARGGFVWYGGLIGGTIAVAYALHRKRLPLGIAADALAPALALGHGIGHIACFFSGDSYGLPSSLPWAIAVPRGAPPSTAGVLRREFGVALPDNIPDSALIAVHPAMLYSAFALIAVFAVLWALRRRREPRGWLFGLYLGLSGIERFLVEFVRATDDRFLWGFTTAQAIAVAAILSGIALLVLLNSRARRKTRPAVAGAI